MISIQGNLNIYFFYFKVYAVREADVLNLTCQLVNPLVTDLPRG